MRLEWESRKWDRDEGLKRKKMNSMEISCVLLSVGAVLRLCSLSSGVLTPVIFEKAAQEIRYSNKRTAVT
jgi:hypothetical protein